MSRYDRSRTAKDETIMPFISIKGACLDKLNDAGCVEMTAKGKATELGGARGDHLSGEAAERGRAVSIETRRAKAKGRAGDLAPIIANIRANGATSLREIATGLNDRDIPAARGGVWSAIQVKRLIAWLV